MAVLRQGRTKSKVLAAELKIQKSIILVISFSIFFSTKFFETLLFLAIFDRNFDKSSETEDRNRRREVYNSIGVEILG